MADFTEICKTNELNDGTMKRVYMEGKDITVARVEGKYYVAAGRCTHKGAFLSRGTLKGTIVTCPMHGSQFDLKDGKIVRWVTGAGIKSLMGKLLSMLGMATKQEKPLAIYEVKVEGERVMAKII